MNPHTNETAMIALEELERLCEASTTANHTTVSLEVVKSSAALLRRALQADAGLSFQKRVDSWLLQCFGEQIARDQQERGHRFLEEALELFQSNGCTASEAHQLVTYVFGRPAGEFRQEVGGVMMTLAALCLSREGIDMQQEGYTELTRVWTVIDKIRAKQAAKPKHSPLPQAVDLVVHTPSLQPLPTFDEWHQQRFGMSFDTKANGMMIADGVMLLGRRIRDYVSSITVGRER